MKHRLIAAAICIVPALTAISADSATYLHVDFTDGSDVLFRVEPSLQWSISGASFTVTGAEDMNSYEISDVQSLVYEKLPESALTTREASLPVIAIFPGGFAIEKASDGSLCHITDIQGRVVEERVFSGFTEFKGLSSGTYIVAVNECKPIKIVVK